MTYLLNQSAEIDARDEDGRTPLMLGLNGGEAKTCPVIANRYPQLLWMTIRVGNASYGRV